MSIESANEFHNRLRSDQMTAINDLLSFSHSVISWDIDQILMLTEDPVKRAFDEQFGTNYSERKIDRWMALAHWAKMEGFNFDEVAEFEGSLWINPTILMRAVPNPGVKSFSCASAEAGVRQIVVTGRNPDLSEMTFNQIKDHFPWIPENNVFVRKNTDVSSGEYKSLSINRFGASVHFEDSVKDGKAIIGLTDAWLMLFPRQCEQGMVSGRKVIEILDHDLWVDLYDNHG